MFCLRSWCSLLIFITNCSPVYVAAFLFGTYLLQKPCVYCSILLFVLVFSLFDFHADWFEPRWQPSTSKLTETASSLLSGNATIIETLSETASLTIAALNGTGGSLVSAALNGAKRKSEGGQFFAGLNENGFEALRNVVEKRQFRIPCVGVNVRL